MNMKPGRHMTVAAFVIGTVAAFQSFAIDVTSSIDIGTYAWTDKATDSPVTFKGDGTADDPNTVMLGRDTTLTGYQFYVARPTEFDFSAGNHTLDGLGTFIVTGGNNVKLLEFKGGKWRFADGMWLRCAYWGTTYAGGQKIIFDGADFEMPGDSWVQGFYGDNNQMLLDNGALLTCGTVSYFFNINGTVTYTNGLVRIANGSKFKATKNITIDGGTPASDKPSGNRIEVTGEGSWFGISGTLGDQEFKIGRYPGESVVFSDHAYGRFSRTVVGSGEYGRNSSLTIGGGAGYLNGGAGMKVGDSVGADGNRLSILDGACFTNNASRLYAGYMGSFNEVAISNASYVGQPIVAGWETGSSNNTVRIEGADSSVSYMGGSWCFFGKGERNAFSFKDCDITLNSHNMYLSDNYSSNADNRFGTTNNTLAVDRNASLTVTKFFVPETCSGNTLFVGHGAKLKTMYEFRIAGDGNRLVISNGTVEAGNYNALVVSNGTEEARNRIVLKGESPALKATASDNQILMYGNSGIDFEVPEDGYSAPPLQAKWIKMYSGGSFSFSGVDACARRLTTPTATYQLTSGGIFIYDETGSENPQPVLDAVNATLPEGCSVYLNNSSARTLMLRVKRFSRAFMVIFR